MLFYSAALLATPQLPVEAVLDPTLPLCALAPRPHHRAVAREPAPRQREPRQCEQRARRLNLAPLRTARARLAARTARRMAVRSSTERSSKETASSEPPGTTSAPARANASCSAIDARTASA